MLQTHDTAGPVVDHFRGAGVGKGAAVIDDVDDPWIFARNGARFLDRHDRRNGPVRREIDGVSRVFGECCQAAFFRRIGR
jgi:hypothetical protein